MTDIDPRFLANSGRANLEVRRHDVATDPLPEAAFDLIHTRLVLIHVPQRDAPLARLVGALKPEGGSLSRTTILWSSIGHSLSSVPGMQRWCGNVCSRCGV